MRRLAVLLVVALPCALLACGSDQTAAYNPPPLNIDAGGDASSSHPLDGGGTDAPGTDGTSPAPDGVAPADGSGPDSGTLPGDASTLSTCPQTFSLPDMGYTTVV